MSPSSRGIRVQVIFGESDRVGHTPRYQAILEYLRREGAAGATVMRGVAGFGANSTIHTAAILRLSVDLPIVLTWIDAPGRVDRLLPGLKQLAGSGIVTIEEVGIAAYGGRRLEQLRFDLQVRDVMTRPAASTQPESTVRDAVGQLLGRDFRALPVIDDDGRLVGILTGGDLVGRGGLGARLELLSAMPGDARTAILARLDSRAAVGAIMTPEPVSVRETDTLATATHLMAERELKRLPVVDVEGRLSGMLSRSDVLRAVSETFPHDVVDGEAHPGAQTVADLMRRDAPTVAIDANLATVLDAVVSTRLNRAVVVDRAGRVVGVITDSDLIGSVDLGGGVLNALMRSVGQRPGATVTAGELLARDLVTVGSATTIAAAARLMIANRRKILCVVDSSGMLLGIVDRADLLRAAGDALHELNGAARSDD